ncbi:MAG: head GIN domain-containing protein [Betaproteobacteria bacterium]
MNFNRNFISRISVARATPIVFAALLLALSPAAHADFWTGKSIKGSGVIKSETRNVSGFTGVSLAVPAKLEIVQGASESLTIEGDDNIVPLIETVVENGTLKIRFTEKNTSITTKALKAVLNVKTLELLSVAGSGDIRAAKLQAGNLKTSISGSGDINIASLDADMLKLSIAGSGSVTAAGKAKNVEANVAGSGDVKLGKLEAAIAKASIQGSGDVTVWAKDSLTVSVAGSGDVKYYGDAKVTKSVAGSGSVKRLGTAP